MVRKPVPWWVSALAAAAALLIAFQPSAGQRVAEIGSQILAPIAFYTTLAGTSLTDAGSDLSSIGTLRQINRSRSEEIERLNLELLRTHELEQENEDLRRLLGFKRSQPNLQLLPARPLGSDATGVLNALIIDKGAKDGIAEDMGVITWRGLAGRIVSVRPTTASVILVSDVSSSIAARVQPASSRASGIVSGRKEGALIMRHILQNETVQTGDLVVTSGVGGSLPSGLPIGTVVRVQKRNVELFQEAVLDAAVDTTKLERLYVILSFPKDQ